MNNTNQQLYTIYKNVDKFYEYRRLVSLDDVIEQDRFIKMIQKDKYIILSAADHKDVSDEAGELDQVKLKEVKQIVSSHNEKSKHNNIKITNIILVYTGTECETKRANMLKLTNHVRYPNAEVIIITPTKISSGVTKGLQSLSLQKEHANHEFRSFTYNLLNFVVPEYELAPKYEILTDDQVVELKEWFIEPDALPKIFENDPQMVWIGAKVGDIVKYIYLSEVTIEGIGYCKVIPTV